MSFHSLPSLFLCLFSLSLSTGLLSTFVLFHIPFTFFFCQNQYTGSPRYLRIRLFTWTILVKKDNFLVKSGLFICEFRICVRKRNKSTANNKGNLYLSSLKSFSMSVICLFHFYLLSVFSLSLPLFLFSFYLYWNKNSCCYHVFIYALLTYYEDPHNMSIILGRGGIKRRWLKNVLNVSNVCVAKSDTHNNNHSEIVLKCKNVIIVDTPMLTAFISSLMFMIIHAEDITLF